MENSCKSDSVLKFILFFGALLLLWCLLGSGYETNGYQSMMSGNSDGIALSGNNLVTGILHLLISLLIVVLIFALLAGLLMGLYKLISHPDKVFSSSSKFLPSTKTLESFSPDSGLKTLAAIVIVILGLQLSAYIFRALAFGGAINPQFIILGIIGFLIKLLTIVLIVSLLLTLAQYLKGQFFSTPNPDQEQESTSPAQISKLTNSPHNNDPLVDK